MESKEWLKNALSHAKTIIIKTEKPDSTEKFGRILGWLYVDDVNLNKVMIDQGYAWEYLGGTKEKDFDALLKKRK
jgi:micrococcal nuclease